MFADNEKKYKKSLKKFGNIKKPPYLCSRNQTTNTPKGKKKISLIIKLQSNENKHSYRQSKAGY